MVPAITTGRIGHPAKLPQRERCRVDADDAGQFEDQLPDVDCRAVSIA